MTCNDKLRVPVLSFDLSLTVVVTLICALWSLERTQIDARKFALQLASHPSKTFKSCFRQRSSIFSACQQTGRLQANIYSAYHSFMVAKRKIRSMCVTYENPSHCKCRLSVALESSNYPGSCKPACSSERDAFCSCLMSVLIAIEFHKRRKDLQNQEGIHKQAAKTCRAADASVEVHLHLLRAKPLSSCQLPSSPTAQLKPIYAIPCSTCSTSWFDFESLSKPSVFFRKHIHDIQPGNSTHLEANINSSQASIKWDNVRRCICASATLLARIDLAAEKSRHKLHCPKFGPYGDDAKWCQLIMVS